MFGRNGSIDTDFPHGLSVQKHGLNGGRYKQKNHRIGLPGILPEYFSEETIRSKR
jgi:hypothetical protein